MNPFFRGLLVVALIAAVIMVLQLYATLVALMLLMQIAFPLAIAYFLFLVWRDRRSDIETWSSRERWVFYGAAGLAIADVLAFGVSTIASGSPSGLDALAFVLVLGFCGFSMWRVWHDAHTYS
jgi:hypothetical protein